MGPQDLQASLVLLDKMVSLVLREKEVPLVRRVKEDHLGRQGLLELLDLLALLVPKA